MRTFVATLLCLISISGLLNAHEEPAKTLKEKADRQKEQKRTAALKIKTLTAWIYVVKDGASAAESSKTIVQEYNTAGYFTAIAAFKNDTMTERDVYSYNRHGDLESDFDFTGSGDITEKNEYRLDAEGRVIAGESRDKGGLVTSRFAYRYNRIKDTIEFIKYNSHDSLEYTLTYFYTGDYDSVDAAAAIKSDPAGKQLLHVENTYDNRRRLMIKKVSGADQKSNYTYYYGYDSASNLVEIRKVLAGGATEWKKMYSYNADGNRAGITTYDGKNVLISLVRYSYEFFK
jgi:YD repeat-containing protein